MSLEIRRVHADEWRQLRALRLRALAAAPLAFGSTLAREEAFSETIWQERAAGSTDRATFIAELDRRWVGLATGIAAGSDGPFQAFPMLVGMFVDASARQLGVGARLVERVAAWAKEQGAERLVLWVVDGNEPAMALYRRCGFQPTGLTRPLAHSVAHRECEMARPL
jgi:GNAT superfamily N-acetyltransferase